MQLQIIPSDSSIVRHTAQLESLPHTHTIKLPPWRGLLGLRPLLKTLSGQTTRGKKKKLPLRRADGEEDNALSPSEDVFHSLESSLVLHNEWHPLSSSSSRSSVSLISCNFFHPHSDSSFDVAPSPVEERAVILRGCSLSHLRIHSIHLIGHSDASRWLLSQSPPPPSPSLLIRSAPNDFPAIHQ